MSQLTRESGATAPMMKQRKFEAMSHLGMVNADPFGAFRFPAFRGLCERSEAHPRLKKPARRPPGGCCHPD
jgi:hypothetical protein